MIDTWCENDLMLLLKNLFRQNHKILLWATSHKVAIISDNVVVNDGWNISPTFLQQTVKQLEVIREVVLLEVSKQNDLEDNEQI